ncbi:hypothetical protein [Yeosuana sp. AK3]
MKKNNLYLLLMMCITTLFLSCGDEIEFTATEAQRAPNFVNRTLSIQVPQENLSLSIPIVVSSLSDSERVFELEAVSSTGSASEYTLSNAVVPANTIQGTATVNFDFSQIADENLRSLTLKMLNPDGAPSNQITIEYFKEILCNDLTLEIVSDVWATETYFTIEEADGTPIVERFFPFSADSTTPQEYSVTFTLPDGDYVLKIGDTFGDGNIGTGGGVTLIGSYKLTCSIITHASNSDGFSTGTPDPFPGAPDAIVEITPFSVNP